MKTYAPASSAALALLVIALSSLAAAQSSARTATLELGFGDAVVANAWNPLRLVLRDVGPVEFELSIDRGTLREGERWLRYRAEVPGGSGLSVFEDELFVPVWRSLSWVVRSGGLTVTSGSLPRTLADRRPLDLVVGEPGPEVRSSLVGGRIVDLSPERLPLRSAAYDGVANLVVATPNARAQSVVAAAVAGSTVVLAPASLADASLATLLPAGEGSRVVGSGRVQDVESWMETMSAHPARFDHAALVSALASIERITPSSPPPVLPLLLGASAYALIVLVMLRFGGLPGLLAALLLALTTSVAAWVPLRPAQSSVDQVTDLVVGADGVGQRWRLHERFTLPARTAVLPVAGWPLSNVEARVGPDSVSVDLGRWRSAQVLERPRAVGMPLVQDEDGVWRNAGDASLALVSVRGGETALDVAPGQRLPVQVRDVGPLPRIAVALLELVPEGAAVASDGRSWFVGLPHDEVWAEAPR